MKELTVDIGKKYEQEAVNYLKEQNCEILERNYSSKTFKTHH